MDPNKKIDPETTDETFPLEEIDDESRDTDPPPYPASDVLVVEDDPDDNVDPDD